VQHLSKLSNEKRGEGIQARMIGLVHSSIELAMRGEEKESAFYGKIDDNRKCSWRQGIGRPKKGGKLGKTRRSPTKKTHLKN